MIENEINQVETKFDPSRMVKNLYDNLLLSILPYIQEMMYAKNLTPNQHNRSSKAMLQMIRTQQRMMDVLELFANDRISSTHFAFYNVERYLNAYVKSVYSLFNRRLLHINIDTSKCTSDVIFDLRRVNFILSQLISNAIMHSNLSENFIDITASLRGDDFVITVANEGRKIHKNKIPHLFSAYEDITNPKRVKDFCSSMSDVKLGLSVCLKAAKDMDGNLVYLPTPKKTVFELTISQKQRADFLLEDTDDFIPDLNELKMQMAGALLCLMPDEN